MITQPVTNDDGKPLPTSQENEPTEQQKPPIGAYVGLNEANRLTGKSKETILKYAKEGKISTVLNGQDKKVYQVVDLERVFGIKTQPTSQENGQSNHSQPERKNEPTAIKVAQLEGEIAKLEAVLEAEREKSRLFAEIAEKAEQNADRWRGQADAVTRMLTHQPEVTSTPEIRPEPKKRWRLFGGGDR